MKIGIERYNFEKYAKSLYKNLSSTLENKPLTMKLPFLSVNHLTHNIDDLYYFATYKWNDIDITTLKIAINTTFKHRNSQEYLEKFNTIMVNVLNDENLIARWDKYRKEHEYAKEIEFRDTISAIEKIYNIL